MYKLLIVDDEEIAVRGIVEGIEWSDIGISEVYSAFNAKEAMAVINSEGVDVIICDIEMPGLDGIELLNKIKEKSLDISTIFLTGHAKFNYAQKAIKLGCFDYLIKPVDHHKIKDIVTCALEEIKEEETKDQFLNTYKKYYSLWQKYQPILIERFWQDVFCRRYMDLRWLKNSLDLYDIHLTMSDQVIPILLSIEEWLVSLSGKDEEIMKYAVRKVAAELMEDYVGEVFQNHDGNNLIIIYTEKSGNPSIDDLKAYCNDILEICQEKLHSILSCYIGIPARIQEMSDIYQRLLELEKNNIQEINSIISLYEFEGESDQLIQPPPFSKWKVLYEKGKGEELIERINLYFCENKEMSFEMLENFYFGLSHMIYEVMHKKGISIKKVYDIYQWDELLSVHCLKTIKKKVENIILTGTEYIKKIEDSDPLIINKIKSYIKNNYKENIRRKDIADYVGYNPAYLSRMFKKETRKTLTEYITDLRLKEARRLLTNTDLSITRITEEIGYNNYYYFSKIFKEEYGITPRDFRDK